MHKALNTRILSLYSYRRVAAVLTVTCLVGCGGSGDDGKVTANSGNGELSTPEAFQGTNLHRGPTVVAGGDDGSAVLLALTDQGIVTSAYNGEDESWRPVESTALLTVHKAQAGDDPSVPTSSTRVEGAAATSSAAWVAVRECLPEGVLIDDSCGIGSSVVTVGRLDNGAKAWNPIVVSTDSAISSEGSVLREGTNVGARLFGSEDQVILVLNAPSMPSEIWSVGADGDAKRIGPGIDGVVDGVCAVGDSLYVVSSTLSPDGADQDSTEAQLYPSAMLQRLPAALDKSADPEAIQLERMDVAGVPDATYGVLCDGTQIVIRGHEKTASVRPGDSKATPVETPELKFPFVNGGYSAGGHTGNTAGYLVGYDMEANRSQVIVSGIKDGAVAHHSFESPGLVGEVATVALADGSVLFTQSITDAPAPDETKPRRIAINVVAL